MITWSIAKLVLFCISIGMACFSLGMSTARLIELLVDRHMEKRSSNTNNKRNKSDDKTTKSDK